MTKAGHTALAFMRALWAGDLDTCFSMMNGDATWHFQPGMPQAQTGRGRVWPAREGLQRVVDDLFGKFDGGFDIDVTALIADEEQAAIEYTATATTADGRAYFNTYATLIRVRGSQICEVRPYNDTAHMLAMIG